jgi:hypothetical protein
MGKFSSSLKRLQKTCTSFVYILNKALRKLYVNSMRHVRFQSDAILSCQRVTVWGAVKINERLYSIKK